MGKRLLNEEGGFTLPEMMVTLAIMLVVLFALYNIFDMSVKVFSFGNDKVEAVENARLGLEKMERELRAAFPVNKVADPPLNHVFFAAGAPGTPALPASGPNLDANERRTITFGNDLPHPPNAPNRRIHDPTASPATDGGEIITYRLNNGSGACPNLPTTETRGVCRLQRSTDGGAFQDVAEYVVPDGLVFELLRSDLADASAADGTDVGVVRISLTVNKDGRTQDLTTDVDLRNCDGRPDGTSTCS